MDEGREMIEEGMALLDGSAKKDVAIIGGGPAGIMAVVALKGYALIILLLRNYSRVLSFTMRKCRDEGTPTVDEFRLNSHGFYNAFDRSLQRFVLRTGKQHRRSMGCWHRRLHQKALWNASVKVNKNIKWTIRKTVPWPLYGQEFGSIRVKIRGIGRSLSE